MKRIYIQEWRDTATEKRLKKQEPFKSYKAVARALNPGEEVTIRVTEPCADTEILMGWGEISKDETSYYYPRRLAHDY